MVPQNDQKGPILGSKIKIILRKTKICIFLKKSEFLELFEIERGAQFASKSKRQKRYKRF